MNDFTVTVQHLLELLGSTGADPVLYLKRDEGTGHYGELGVWAESYAHYSDVVVKRHDLIDSVGSNPGIDDLAEYLPEVQRAVDLLLEAEESA
ncbi:hypothetical protein ABT282_08425 [Streptomyces sp. NPDC000927]|uniref:hypothetical protein n=1 Tax=Streptomyces sp. NPDC000927 TaxID=3154371 RepID=UPI00331B420C